MSSLTRLGQRVIVCAILCVSLSACVTTNTDAVYYNPAVASGYQVYGYNPVDFNALGHR